MMIKKYGEWLNEGYSLAGMLPSREQNPSGRKMLDEISENLANLGFPDSAEETGSLYYNTMMPSLTIDMKMVDWIHWKAKKTIVKNKEEVKNFLLALDENFYGEDTTVDYKDYDYFEIAPSDSMLKFAASWGFRPFIMMMIDRRDASDDSGWAMGLITLVHDEKLSHDNRGSIHARKYNV